MANLRRYSSIENVKADAARDFVYNASVYNASIYNASVYNVIRRKSPCTRIPSAEDWTTAFTYNES